MLRISSQAFVVQVVVVLIELQTQQVYYPHGSHLPVSLVLGRTALTGWSLKIILLRNPTILRNLTSHEFQNDVSSIPVGGNSPSIAGWIV